jgi:apolipoprotein N-acyltransferase
MNNIRMTVVVGLTLLAMAAVFLATSMTLAWDNPTTTQKLGTAFCWFVAVEHIVFVAAAFYLHYHEDTINKVRHAYTENIGLRTRLTFVQQERCGLTRSYNQLARRLKRFEPDVELLSESFVVGKGAAK